MLSLVPDVGRLVRSVLAVCLSMQITAACVEGCSCQFLVAIHNSLSHQGKGVGHCTSIASGRYTMQTAIIRQGVLHNVKATTWGHASD